MEDPTLDLWATDEVHFQQHGSRCQMWIQRKPRTRSCCMLPRAAQRGIFWRGATARREVSVLQGM
jgi:hypothetical protein